LRPSGPERILDDMPPLPRRARPLRVRIGACAALACAAPQAHAAELKLSEPLACVTADELSFRVERALGQPLAQAPALEFRVSPRQTSPRDFSAQLEISEASGAAAAGSRTLLASSCDELLDTLALAMALVLGSRRDGDVANADEAAPSEARAAVASASSPPDAAVTDRPAPVARPSEPEPGEAAHLVMRAGAVGDTGALPSAGLGVSAGAGLRWPTVELFLLGTLLPRREGTVDPSVRRSPGARVGLIAGSLSACLPLNARAAAILLDGCAGWELGQLSGDGTHVEEPNHQSSLWSAARVDVDASWRVPGSALGIGLRLGALAPLTRDRFVLKDIGSVYRPASLVGRATLNLIWDID
jgi:hypothetical protein